MNRFLVAAGAMVLAVGCEGQEPSVKRECELEALDLSSCNRTGLATVQAEGIWNLEVKLPELSLPAAMRLTPENGLMLGFPLSQRQVEGETFFLGSSYLNEYRQPVTYVLAGCEARAPDQVSGVFRRCVDGAEDLSGTFEAVRVQRRAGEAEAVGLERVSEVALPKGGAVDVSVGNGHAFVAALSDGLVIYDVSVPAEPRKVASLTPQSDSWFQTWLKGQTLYVASAREGVIVYDVTDPAVPKRLAVLPSNGAVEARGLYVDQERLYVFSPAPRAEVLLYDVTVPTEPALLSRHVVVDSLVSLGERPVGGVALGNRLYLGHWSYGLAVVDVTDPGKPADLGRFTYPDATSRHVAVGELGGRMVVFESGEDWGAHLRVLDVTDPAHITQIGEYRLRPESTVSGLRLVGTKLYVAHNQDGLRVLDVSNPGEPREVGYYNTWRETDEGRGQSFLEGLSAVAVPGDGYVYGTDTSRGLLIFREQG